MKGAGYTFQQEHCRGSSLASWASGVIVLSESPIWSIRPPPTHKRMDYASRILLESDATVNSVAAALGFKDPFYFSQVFKSVHHVPPSRFRQSMHPQWPS